MIRFLLVFLISVSFSLFSSNRALADDGCVSPPSEAAAEFLDGLGGEILGSLSANVSSCKQQCSAVKSACSKAAGTSNSCTNGLDSAIAKAAKASCDEIEDKAERKSCKQGVNEEAKSARDALRADFKSAKSSCSEVGKSCKASCGSPS